MKNWRQIFSWEVEEEEKDPLISKEVQLPLPPYYSALADVQEEIDNAKRGLEIFVGNLHKERDRPFTYFYAQVRGRYSVIRKFLETLDENTGANILDEEMVRDMLLL